jgi:NifU-like protein
VALYPSKVQIRCESPQNAGVAPGENACGTDASFTCGSYVRFSIRIEPETKLVASAGFQTNGCGYMIAAADVLAESVHEKHLSELHGLNDNELRSTIEKRLDRFEENRLQCVDCCIRAIRSTFADYRNRQIEEFRGEKALICTCFGVSEEEIESRIAEQSLKTVDEVANECNAGTGCGSCSMLIQEMLDRFNSERDIGRR